MTDRDPSIVVVGAGVAGLAAAKKLKECGFNNVTVLEASEKVGGRVATAAIGKASVDTGAQFIHGATEKNPLYCLLKKSGLLSQVADMGSEAFYSNKGQKVDEKFARSAYDDGEGILRHRGINTRRSLGEHFAEKTQAVIDSLQDSEEKKRKQSVFALVGKDMLIDVGASNLHSISLDSWQYYVDMGDTLSVAGLMFQLVNMLLEDFPKDRVLLKREVSKIRWDGAFSAGKDMQPVPHDEPLTAQTESISEGTVRQFPVCVVCENGEEILADHVIVTVSLGCLKTQASSLFIPSLPAEKMDVIDKLCFGNIAKVFLEYEEAFWENDVGTFSLIYEDDSPASVTTNKTQWLRNMQYFTVMRPKERFDNTLIGWCPGDIADLIETMAEEEVSIAITGHLRMFFGNPNIPPPKSILCTKWRSNRLTRGSYTFLPVGVDGQVMDTLAQPLKGVQRPDEDLQVMFAGEATMKTLYGTVHGALLSGHREADRLAAYYKKSMLPIVTASMDNPV
ncbi:polyamine oxidase (exo-N4-amino) 1 [Xyrauchen texanus]|uniref:polyamine oxidase (exo-N4-amino) 1 n=1 Tax=Xyrauchen texanus TaxID=154827 RepID=UPI0022420A26|nr:polyamine oxidase (exo-N4-amino) 1 [Xyrauchen texanus]XP_051964680.1 polyamine oxidase (exo-N4-amino) 1 [Xyrauchen texanus]